MIEDFPALGRPTTAKRGMFSSISGSDFLVKRFNISLYCHSFESALFATKITGLSERRNIAATWSSRSTAPVFTSTMNKITSASSIAKATCLLISSSKISSELTTQPPVSITENS